MNFFAAYRKDEKDERVRENQEEKGEMQIKNWNEN